MSGASSYKPLRPKCCRSAEIGVVSYPGASVTFALSATMWEKDVEPNWRIDGTAIKVSFCPFCGTKLPGFEKKTRPPKMICKPASDGDYCETCYQRAGYCRCYPREAAFTLKGPT